MSDDPEADAILTRFRAALGEIYGDRLERVVLYGSRARGDHRPDSDYDIAVFIKDPGTLGEEIRRLEGVETDILSDTGAVINALPFRAGLIGSARGSCTSCGKTDATYEIRSCRSPRKARHCLAGARRIAAAEVPDVVAREAHLAAHHAAEAYIFEQTGRAAKTDRGARSQLNRLAQREPRIQSPSSGPNPPTRSSPNSTVSPVPSV
jgi:predicted nucleotidyltransferase